MEFEHKGHEIIVSHEGRNPLIHDHDEDCQPYLIDDECVVCGVYHGDPCPWCEGRGYHAADCNAAVARFGSDQDTETEHEE